MVASRFVLTGFAAIACTSALLAEEDVFVTLLKRQAPGTPEYNCHDNCGSSTHDTFNPSRFKDF
jgi:hypothetical protein